MSCVDQLALLRPGGLPRELIERTLGRPLTIAAVAEDPHRARHVDVALRTEGRNPP